MTLPSNSRVRERISGEAGFSLIELLVVIVIIGLLGALVAPNLLGHLGRARTQTAQAQIDALISSVDMFHLDVGRYPTEEEGLAVMMTSPANEANWHGPYVRRQKALIDPWGRVFRYRFPGEHGAYDIWSYGSDDQPGGEGEARDVVSW